jgi:hypothetical protein
VPYKPKKKKKNPAIPYNNGYLKVKNGIYSQLRCTE